MISILQELLRLVMWVVFQLVDILLEFPADGSQVNSRRYHFVFCNLTCPHFFLAAPAKSLRPHLASLTVSYVGVLLARAI